MKYFKHNYILLLLLTSLVSTTWGKVDARAQGSTSFELSLPDVIVEGEQFRISFTVNADAKNFRMEEPAGIQVLYGPSLSRSKRTSIINGKHQSEEHTSFTYVMMAEKAGEYEIPSASVQVGSSTYRTRSRKFTVYPPSAVQGQSGKSDTSDGKGSTQGVQVSDKDIFVTATATKTNVYEQEGLLVTFKIYSQHDFNFEDVKFPEFDGFISQDVEMPQVLQLKAEQYKGRVYRTVEIKQTYLFPQRDGTLTVPSGSFQVILSIPVRGQVDSMDSFFDNFFATTQTVRKVLKSNPITIKVKPLPSPRPEGFDGAVGTFDLSIEAPESVTKANESIRINAHLKGSGNIKLVQIPSPKFPEGFETYDPKEEEVLEVTTRGVSGEKKTEFYAVPRFPGDYIIPGVEFVYFDPASSTYKTINTKEIKIHVDKGSTTTSTSVSNFTDKQEVKYLGKDIRYLKKSTGSTTAQNPKLYGYLIIYLAIVILTLVVFFVLQSKRDDIANISGYKSKRAGKLARRWLKLAIAKRDSGDHSAFYEALLKGLSDYLSSKFRIPLSSLSKENISSVLAEKGISQDTITQTIDALSALELARYTPSGDKTAREQLYDQCVRVIEDIESSKTK